MSRFQKIEIGGTRSLKRMNMIKDIEHIMRNAGLDEAQVGIKISGRNINNFRYADDTTLTAESETKEPLDESERGE